MKGKTIIFDLDGTLIDPSAAICRSINYALEKKGHKSVAHSRIYPYIGRHLLDPFRDITGVHDENYLWEMVRHYRERYETIGIAENSLYTGIKEMIERSGSQNYIASIKPAYACRLVLQELKVDKYFAGVYGSESDGTRANKTELLHYLKDLEGINNAVMVGDRDTDIFAAKSCGFFSVGVCYGYGSREELSNAGADAIVEKPENLEIVLKEIWKN